MDFIKRLLGKKMSRSQFNILVSRGAVVVDVRSPDEFHKEGHLPGALNIPLQFIIQKAEKFRQEEKIVITVCRRGVRSTMAVTLLKNAGVNAHNGGSWLSLQ